MKKLRIVALIATVAAATTAFKLADLNLKIKGSDTVLPLSQKFAEVFMKKHPETKISVVGGGSGVGISSFIEGTTDIAMASRKMKMSEKMKMQDAGKAFKEVIIAYDALSVIVNTANKVSQLTREQLEGIFTGKIVNWKEVGGDDEKIIVYSRESSSGTYEFFKEHIMQNKNFASSVLNMPATGAIVQSVSQTKGAIGYIGLAYLDKNVKGIKISMDKGKTFVEPSMKTAKDKTYGVIRSLQYYYLSKDEAKVKPFMDFILSAEGQKIVEEIGYVPIH